MTQSNAEILRGGYEAFAEGDVPAVLALFADDIAWHVPGNSPIAGDYAGHDEVLGFFGKLMDLSGGTFSIQANDLLDNHDDTVVALVTWTAERNGEAGTFDEVHVWTMQSGKAVAFTSYQGDGPAEDAFWSS